MERAISCSNVREEYRRGMLIVRIMIRFEEWEMEKLARLRTRQRA